MEGINSKKEKHINFLRKIKFLICYNDLELYHGRCQNDDSVWCVRTDVDNSSSVEQNNIMAIPCLCVATYTIAESYARGTSLDGRTGKAMIYEIVSTDENSLIVNEKFDINKLSEKDTTKFHQAIQGLSKSVLSDYIRQEISSDIIMSEIKSLCSDFKLISQSDEAMFFENLILKGMILDKNLVHKIVGAINSNIMFKRFPVSTVSDFVFLANGQRDYFSSSGEKYSVNQSFIRYLMDKNNIIALKKKAFSGDDDIVYVFNLSKIQTLEQVQRYQMQ